MAATLTESQQRRGLGQLTSAEALQAMERVMLRPQGQSLVARVDWQRIWAGRTQTAMVSHIVQPAVTGSLQSSLSDKLMAASGEQVHSILLTYLRQLTAEKLDEEDVTDLERGFMDMFPDSLDLNELAAQVSQDLRLFAVPKGELLYNYPNIKELSAFLADCVYGKRVDLLADKDAAAIASWGGQLPTILKPARFGKWALFIKSYTGETIDAVRDQGGRTALYVAACAGHVEFCRQAIAHGAALDYRSQAGITPEDIIALPKNHDLARQLQATNFSTLGK